MITTYIKQCLKISLLGLGLVPGMTAIAIAQVTPDGTIDTQVNQNGNTAEITGGATEGNNLFHSFQDFSVNAGNEAFFNNAGNVGNIFSRVTGGNVSNINGAIRANGSANLFLINPAGVIFGEGASLDIGGSFYGSSASGVLFEDGEFSATDLENPPLLTVNAPVGLNFRSEPGEVTVNAANLSSTSGSSLNLIGGEVNITSGNLNAPGGMVNIGAVSSAGIVNINENVNLDFSSLSLADVNLSDGSVVNVSGNGGGAIAINAENLTLAEASLLSAGISDANSTEQAQGGNIEINVTNNVALNSGSFVVNNIEENSFGSSGDINIETTSLELTESSAIFTNVAGEGSAGSLNLTASDRLTLEDSSLQADVLSGAVGNAGNINITTNLLRLAGGVQNNRSLLATGTSGTGDAGDITIDANDVALADGSIFITQVQPEAVGNAGDITVNTANLSLTGSDITVNTEDLAPGETADVTSSLIANTQGTGNAGNITINATGDITTNGSSSILSQVRPGAVGNSGDINITANSLNLNQFELIANTRGEGNAGRVTISAVEDINLDRGSLILSQVRREGIGEAGGIEIGTGSLQLNNSLIVADSSGIGSSGDITINATEDITLQGLPTVAEEVLGSRQELPSQIITGLDEFINLDTRQVENSGQGQAGSINITASQLNLTDLASISSNVEETTSGSGGEVILNVNSVNIDNNAAVGTFTANSDDAGSITVNGASVELASGGRLVTATDGAGNAGTINLNLSDRLTIDNANAANAPTLIFNNQLTNELLGRTGLFANATERATGNAGSINIGQNQAIPQNINFANGAEVRVDSAEQGNAGSIAISTDTLSLENSEITAVNAAGNGGNINITAQDLLLLSGDSLISSAATNFANGGNVTLATEFIIATPGNSDILANAEQGQGGEIDITAESLLGIAERSLDNSSNDINASSEVTGLDGTITINTPDLNPAEGAAELPNNVIEPREIAAQACNVNVAKTQTNSLTIEGKGGIPQRPVESLDSENIVVQGQAIAPSATKPEYEPVKTSYGNIVPARGLEVTKDGVILTAHSTQSGNRLPNKRNCG